jgi:outer membrane protein TolC
MGRCVAVPYIPVCEVENMGAAAGEPLNLTIQEAVSIAMSNSQAVRNLGLVEAASRNDIVRSVITTYDPLVARSEAQAQWGIFDPLWTTEMLWDKQDIPPGTSFSGIGNRPPQLDTADFYTSIEQLLPVGTRVRFDLVTDYLFNPDKPPSLNPNPQYFSYNQYGITQPLLQGFGVPVTMAPIKIACAEAEQTDWQFKQEMLALVRSIETTYWALYAQQQNLRAIDEVLPHFREVVRLQEQQAGTTVGVESELGRARSDLYLYEQRRLEVLSKIAEQQLVLRNLMGVPPSDCRDIRVLAVPVTTKPFETLQQSVDTAVSQRPDVLRQRLAVFIAQQERLLADNAVKPRLDLNGYWRTNGLGEDLEQSWEVKDGNNFNSWHMGVFFQVPLGRRQAFANLRAADYRIQRERALLEQTAHQASYEVTDAYRRLHWVFQQLEVVTNREQALAQWASGARAQFENPPEGLTPVFALERYLQNLREASDASISKNQLLAEYNSALARLEEVKGTLLENRAVVVAGDTTDSMPSGLPTPEITMPPSVQPAPTPDGELPNPAEPQGAIGVPQPQREPIAHQQAPAETPQPLPPVDLEMPPSVKAEPQGVASVPAPIAEESTPIAAEPAPIISQPKSPSIVAEPQSQSIVAEPWPAPMEEPQPIAAQPTPQPLEEAAAKPAPMDIARELPQETLQAMPTPKIQLPAPLKAPESTPKMVREIQQPLPAPSLSLPESVLPQLTDQSRLSAPAGIPKAIEEPRQVESPHLAQPKDFADDNARSSAQPHAVLSMPASIRPSEKSAQSMTTMKPAPEQPAMQEPQAEEPAAVKPSQPISIARRPAQSIIKRPPQATLQMPGSIQPAPGGNAPSVASGSETLPMEPKPAEDVDFSAGPISQPTPSVPMQFPSSIQPQSPSAMTTPAPLESATTQPTATSLLPMNQASRGVMPQLEMPRSMTSAEARVARAPAVPARPAVNRRAPNAGPVATPIAQPNAGPELRFPNSIEAAAR